MQTWIVMGLVAAPAAAFAESFDPYADPDPARSPGFVTMDRLDATSRAGIEGTYMVPNSDVDGGVTALRFDVHAQYVDPLTRVGGYVQLPISYFDCSSTCSGSSSATGIGDVEVGGIYAPRLMTSNFALVLHAGITLPTGSTSDDGVATNEVGALLRLTDFYLSVPKGLSARVGISPLVRSGPVFARLDLGYDANISAEHSDDISSILRINVGIGVIVGNGVSIMAESVNLHMNQASDADATTGDSWINTGAISVRQRSRDVQPYAAVVVPLDGQSHHGMSAALTVGVEGHLAVR